MKRITQPHYKSFLLPTFFFFFVLSFIFSSARSVSYSKATYDEFMQKSSEHAGTFLKSLDHAFKGFKRIVNRPLSTLTFFLLGSSTITSAHHSSKSFKQSGLNSGPLDCEELLAIFQSEYQKTLISLKDCEEKLVEKRLLDDDPNCPTMLSVVYGDYIDALQKLDDCKKLLPPETE
jgi:hypothetical protein